MPWQTRRPTGLATPDWRIGLATRPTLIPAPSAGSPLRAGAEIQPTPQPWRAVVRQRPLLEPSPVAIDSQTIVRSYATTHQRLGLVHVLAYGVDPPGYS